MIAQILGIAGLFAVSLPVGSPTPPTAGVPVPNQTGRRSADPKEWRDSRRPEIRAAWDKLEGRPAPALSALTEWTNSEALDWAKLRGKVVLIDYWATWCGPCRQGIPHLKQMQAKHAEAGLVILGVHSAQGWEKMRGLAKSEAMTYPLAADKERALGAELGVQFLPSYFAIDRNGIMRIAGAERSQLDAIVEGLLAEPVETSPDVAASDAVGDAAWPKHVEKKLYSKDLRGKSAPVFEATEWMGPKPDLGDKVVIYDLWATWCSPCRKGIPKLNEYQQKFGEDVTVIGVSDETSATVRDFLKKNIVGYPMAIDGGKLKRAIGVQAIPNAIVVTRDGIVRWQGVPHLFPDALSEATLKRIIELNRQLPPKSAGAR